MSLHGNSIGRAGRDCELKITQAGKSLAFVNVAIDTGFGDKRTTEWVTLKFFNKQAEYAANNIKKGQRVYFNGDIALESWESDGKTHSKISVLVRDFELIDRSITGNKEDNQQVDDVPF